MVKADKIAAEGVVKEALPNATFKVELTQEGYQGHLVNAYLSGKMRMNYIKVLEGDRVTVEISIYDLNRGIITFRHKPGEDHKTIPEEINLDKTEVLPGTKDLL